MLCACSAFLRTASVVAGAWASCSRGWHATEALLTACAAVSSALLAAPEALRDARTLLQGAGGGSARAERRKQAVRDIRSLPGVLDVRDEHWWVLADDRDALAVATLCVCVRAGTDEDATRRAASERLAAAESGRCDVTVLVTTGTDSGAEARTWRSTPPFIYVT